MHVTSALSHLECSKCAARYDADAIAQLCACGAPLLARYDLQRAARTFTRDSLAAREPAMWRYAELLPIRDEANRVSLGETMTPILSLPRLGAQLGLEALSLKDESTLPTGSFKARGAATGVSRAKELGVRAFAMPTNGNAGAAWAAYAARAGIEARIVMPKDAPAIHRWECETAGARLTLVDGFIGDAGRAVAAEVAAERIYDASTLKEPYRIEGKKSMGFELVEQLDWSVPDVILYPTGGGVGLIGIDKALCELREIGLIADRMPRFVVVQAEGCAPIVEAFRARASESVPWKDTHTVAFGIAVPKAIGDFLVLEALYRTGGTAVSVSDAELLDMQRSIASREGIFVCPEGAATLAAASRLRESGWIESNERVLAINTGSALKTVVAPQRDR